MFYIDHNAKTTSFIDPRLPNELPLLQNEAGSLIPNITLLDPNDQGSTLLPPPPPRHHGACLTPPPSAKGPVSPSRLGMISYGVIHKPCGQFLGTFDPPPPSWSLLLNKAYVVIWTFG